MTPARAVMPNGCRHAFVTPSSRHRHRQVAQTPFRAAFPFAQPGDGETVHNLALPASAFTTTTY
ncbi:hypothetical protein KCP78_01635 [Salmonella enterica subsp. enterica]|nr:hypothetical protein KCP78_01635 [Salmonella enterica subsp. enterica]